MNEQRNHIVKSYDEEQNALLDELIRMGRMSVAQLDAALDVVERRDDKAAERVIGNDDAIDALEQQVNHDVIRLIRRGPLAGDLRVILAALRVRASDAELDTLYTGLFRELLTYMMEDARAITPCTHLLFMAKNLERIGDHATNIAENVWFLVHGDDLMPPRDKRDGTNVAP